MITAVTNSRRRFAYPISVGMSSIAANEAMMKPNSQNSRPNAGAANERGGIARPAGLRGRIVPVDDDLGRCRRGGGAS